MKKRRRLSAFDIFNYSLNIFVMLIMIYPLYVIIISSFSDVSAVAKGEVYLLPQGFTLEAYTNVFKEENIWIGYKNSLIYMAIGVCYDTILTITCGYVLSKKYLPGRQIFNWYFFITMYVSGGMIPDYLMRKDMNLLDTRFVLILASMSCYNMLIAKNYFSSSISESLYEAASIDGASELQRFWRIGLPLSKPIIAVLALFQAVARWNAYRDAMLYVRNRAYYPLQLVLREILITSQLRLEAVLSDASATLEEIEAAEHLSHVAQSMKYSVVFIACAPLLIMYPFVQKHFVKGVMIGSVKG